MLGALISFINKLIQFLADAVILLLNILPQTPFSWDLGALGPFWGVANYFIPFGAIAGIMATYVTAVAIWYGVRWILRIAKYIS
jgi:hypothetical protein